MPISISRSFSACWTTLLAGLLSLVAGSFFSADAAVGVSLAWDPNPGSSTAGYRLYYGTSSGSYTGMIDVGNATTATVAQLTAGTTYFFAVTAYNIAALESLPSDEVSFTIPPAQAIQAISAMQRLTNGSIQFTVTNPVGQSVAMSAVDIEISSDLQTWTLLSRILNSTGKLTVNDPGASSVSRRFYRVTIQ